MRNLYTRIAGLLVLSLALAMTTSAQEAGDYRSAANGSWGDAATWEMFDGADWAAAVTAPDGSEDIVIDDTVTVDAVVTISGNVTVVEQGALTVDGGTLEFADGSTYEHARDAGDVPVATWAEGSTFLLTGTEQDAPGNRNQDFYHVVINTPDLGRNRDLSLNGVTIGGNVHVITTGANRWQLTSASGGESAEFTIMGDVIVDDGQFAVQGTGNAMTDFTVHHHGDIIVNGGNFSAARGSQGSGSGTTTWILYGGDFVMSNAATQNSNPTPGNAKYLFAGAGTQQLDWENVEFAGGQVHFEVSDSTTLEIAKDVTLNGLLVNRGEITTTGALTLADGAVYEHARDGGAVPTVTWEEGSTAHFTGIESSGPDNRGQDYHHLILDSPGLLSNLDMSLGDNTIGGDLTVRDSGSSRWRLIGGSSGTITIMGDVNVEGGNLETQGTGSETHVEIHHYGDVNVDGGNFSVSRGSQSGGLGTTTWILFDGDFSMANARTQNSNPTPGNAKFVFARGSGDAQLLTLGEGNQLDNLSIEVADSASLDLGMNVIEGNGIFWLQEGATVLTSHPDGLSGNLQTTGDVNFGMTARIVYNGTEAQQLGSVFPDSLGVLTIENEAEVTASDTLYVLELNVREGATLVTDSTGSISTISGNIDGTLVNGGEVLTVSLIPEDYLVIGPTGLYEHARNGGSVPTAVWLEGSTALFTGVTDEAPSNRGQSYHHLILNTPDQSSNLHMSLTGQTISGDITLLSSGGSRWYLTSASPEDSAEVTILGDVNVEDGQFSVQGTSAALTTFIVHHYGDINVTGGNFSIARGSQSNTGETSWYLHEGDFSIANATTQNSNPGNTQFVFAGSDTQVLNIGDEVTISNLPIEVLSGATLDVGTGEIGGGDIFVLNEGATLITAHPDGVAGTIQSTGELTLDEGASFVFNGTEPQVTSTLMPTTVFDLTIDNEEGVTLSQETTINGTLLLLAGVFDNTIGFTLGENGQLVREGGSLLDNTDSEAAPDVPASFALHQNYPNPFNPSTTIRYDIKEMADVTVTIYDVTGRAVTELVRGPHTAGSYEVQWDAQHLSSGVYFYQITAGDWSATRSLMLVK